jgi:hypothetical protein
MTSETSIPSKTSLDNHDDFSQLLIELRENEDIFQQNLTLFVKQNDFASFLNLIEADVNAKNPENNEDSSLKKSKQYLQIFASYLQSNENKAIMDKAVQMASDMVISNTIVKKDALSTDHMSHFIDFFVQAAWLPASIISLKLWQFDYREKVQELIGLTGDFIDDALYDRFQLHFPKDNSSVSYFEKNERKQQEEENKAAFFILQNRTLLKRKLDMTLPQPDETFDSNSKGYKI